jgi:hypothetical protein
MHQLRTVPGTMPEAGASTSVLAAAGALEFVDISIILFA